MKYKKTLISFALSSVLLGCGGGEDSSSTSPITTKTEVMPIGLWEGKIVNGGVTYKAAGLVAPNGEARFIVDNGDQNKAMIALSGNGFTGGFTGYDNNGLLIGTGNISGAYSSSAITGSTVVDGNMTNSFSFSPSNESNDGASLDIIEGNYTTLDYEMSISVDLDGVLAGSDTDGCQYNGKVTIPDSSVNVYRVALNVGSCGEINGEYSGLATYATYSRFSEKIYSENISQKGLLLQVDNGVYSLTTLIIQ